MTELSRAEAKGLILGCPFCLIALKNLAAEGISPSPQPPPPGLLKCQPSAGKAAAALLAFDLEGTQQRVKMYQKMEKSLKDFTPWLLFSNWSVTNMPNPHFSLNCLQCGLGTFNCRGSNCECAAHRYKQERVLASSPTRLRGRWVDSTQTKANIFWNPICHCT